MVALLGMIVNGLRIDFHPPEFRCQRHRHEDADGADVVELMQLDLDDCADLGAGQEEVQSCRT